MTILILILFAVAAFVAVPAVGPIGIVAGAVPTLALIALAVRALRQPIEAPRASHVALSVGAADERELIRDDELTPPAHQLHG